MNTYSDSIAQHPFSRDLDSHCLQLLRECASYQRFAAGETIFREGFQATGVYLLHSGSVSLEIFIPERGARAIQTIGANEVLGWSWLYPPFCWRFSAIALEPVEATVLCATTLRQKMEENRDFGYAIAMRVGLIMFERLQTTRQRLLELMPAPSR
jgi:CRP-like cAMP-binding protein